MTDTYITLTPYDTIHIDNDSFLGAPQEGGWYLTYRPQNKHPHLGTTQIEYFTCPHGWALMSVLDAPVYYKKITVVRYAA